MSYSVILPTLNEKGHILNLIKSISDIFKKKDLKYEIIVVDDRSSDGTIEIIQEFEKKNNFLKFILRKNAKKNLAESLNEGIKRSNNDYIIWMDADFQHPPRYINKFIDVSKNFDAVISSRFLKESNRYFHNKKLDKEINENQSYFFNKICNFFLYKDITDYTSGFICIKRYIFTDYFLEGYYGDYFISLITYLKKNNKTILEIPFQDDVRASGESKTVVNINLKYVYTCIRYLITFFKNFLKK